MAAPSETVDPKLIKALGAMKFQLPGDFPYLSRLAALLVVRFSSEIGTACVYPDGLTLFNPEWSLKILAEPAGIQKLYTVYLHELWHLVLRHGKRREEMGVLDEQIRHWQLACDAALNQSLHEMGRPFPATAPGCFPKLIPNVPGFELGLEVGKTAEWYFAQLLKMAPPPPPSGGYGAMAGDCGEGVEKSKGGSSPGDEDGKPEGMKGNFSPEEIGESARAALSQIKADAEAGQLKGLLKGSMPAGLAIEIDRCSAPARVPWQEILRRELSMGLERRAGMADFVFGIISRKQAGVGWGDGCPILPGPTDYEVDIAIILDCSGSMMGQPLIDAVVEACGIVREFGPVRVLVADTEVHQDKKVSSADEIVAMLQGGGGTAMQPGFDRLNASPTKPTVAVCITDGYIGSSGPEPEYPVVWCLTTNYTNDVKCWGEIVQIFDPDAKTDEG